MKRGETYHNRQVLLVLFLGIFIGTLDIAIVGPALPALRQDFPVTERSLAWIFTLYLLLLLVGTPVMTKLSDLFGRRAVYIADVSLFAAGSALVSLSSTFAMVLLGRVVQGFGAGGIFPVAAAIVGDTFPAGGRGSVLGMIGAVYGIAFIVGPVLAGVLLLTSWRLLFLINIPIAAAIILLGRRVLPAASSRERQPFDWKGALVFMLLMAALSYGINNIHTGRLLSSLVSAKAGGALLAALLLLPVFIAVERRQKEPLLRLSLLRARDVMLASIIAAGSGFCQSAFIFLPAMIVVLYGVDPSTASFMLVPLVLAMTAASPVAGKLLDRWGARPVTTAGTLLLGCGLLLLSIFGRFPAALFFSGALVGMGIAALPARYIFLQETPEKDRTSAQGFLSVVINVGQMVGVVFLGAVIASRGSGVEGYSSAFALSGLMALGLVFVSTKLKAGPRAGVTRGGI
ncbi:MAG: MFS transporter [Endomicrobiales bacterium]